MKKSSILYLILSLILLIPNSVLAQKELTMSDSIDVYKLNKETEVVSVSFETKDKRVLFGDLSDLEIQQKVSYIMKEAKNLDGDYVENIRNSIINDSGTRIVRSDILNIKAGSIEELNREELNREEKLFNSTTEPRGLDEKYVETIIELRIETFSVFNTHLKGTYNLRRYKDSNVYYINTQVVRGINYHIKDSIESDRLGAFAIFKDVDFEGHIIPSLLRADFKIGEINFSFEGWSNN